MRAYPVPITGYVAASQLRQSRIDMGQAPLLEFCEDSRKNGAWQQLLQEPENALEISSCHTLKPPISLHDKEHSSDFLISLTMIMSGINECLGGQEWSELYMKESKHQNLKRCTGDSTRSGKPYEGATGEGEYVTDCVNMIVVRVRKFQ